MEVRVLLEGYLEKCSTAEDQGRRDWRRRYFVLKHLLTSNIRCLEYYKDRNWRKQDPKGVLTLHTGYQTLRIHDPKKKYAFDLKCVEHTFRLAANSNDEQDKWLQTLETENIVKSFIVEVEPAEQLIKLGAQEKCHLYIANTELRLIAASDGCLLVTWPFTCLRRYMSTKGCFTIEAGRRAPTGEGKFLFRTSQHDEIYKILDSVIKSKAGQSKDGRYTQEKLSKMEASPPSTSTSSNPPNHTDIGYDRLVSPFPLPAHGPHPNYDQATAKKASEDDAESAYSSAYGHLQGREGEVGLGGDGTTLSQIVQSVGQHESDKMAQSAGVTYDVLDHPQSPAHHKPVHLHHFTSPPPSKGKDGVFSESSDSVTTSLPPVAEGYVGVAFYSTIDPGNSPPVVPVRGTATSDADNVYNTLDHGQGSLPVGRPVAPVRGTVPLQQPTCPIDVDNVYNTLDHGQSSLPVGRPVVPVRGIVPSQQPTVASDVDNVYNTLDHGQSSLPVGRPVVPIKGSAPSQQPTAASDVDNVYNTLDHGQSSLPVGRPVVPARGNMPPQQKTEDRVHNIVDHASKVKPVLHSPLKQTPGSYDTLEHAQFPKQPIRPAKSSKPSPNTAHSPATKSPVKPSKPPKPVIRKQVEQSPDESYSVLDHGTLAASCEAELDNTYNTLHHLAIGSPVNPVVVLRKCPLDGSCRPDVPTVRHGTTQVSDRHSMPDAPYPLDHGFLEYSKGDASIDQADPGSYATLDHTAISPAKGPAQAHPFPKEKTGYPAKPAPFLPKVRKASAPDILAFRSSSDQGGVSPKKGGGSSLVSNLRASLEAGGLDPRKSRMKPWKPSREDSLAESEMYAEIDEKSCQDIVSARPTTGKTGRSPSLPPQPISTEGIYEEPGPPCRLTSVQVAKSKHSNKK